MVDTKVINSYLEEQEIKHSNLGYRYLLTAILLGFESPPLCKKITDLYENLAGVCFTKASNVEHAIRCSISKKCFKQRIHSKSC